MQPIKLEGAVNYGAPKDWDEAKDGPCYVLPVVKTESFCTSVWTFTEAERLSIFAGDNLALQIAGGQPPVAMSVVAIRGEGVWDSTGFVEPVPKEPEPVETWRRLLRRLAHYYFGIGYCRGDNYCDDCGRVQR